MRRLRLQLLVHRVHLASLYFDNLYKKKLQNRKQSPPFLPHNAASCQRVSTSMGCNGGSVVCQEDHFCITTTAPLPCNGGSVVWQWGLRCNVSGERCSSRFVQIVVLQILTNHLYNSEISGKNIFPDREAILALVQTVFLWKRKWTFLFVLLSFFS